jgi:hypothetical protein
MTQARAVRTERLLDATDVRPSRRLRLRGSAAGNDYQGAQTHHQGFQTMTS